MANKTIWKYVLETTDRQVIQMPIGFKLLSVQTQNGSVVLWALVDSDERETVDAVLLTVGTGHPANHIDVERYIGTYQIGGYLVFHVFLE